jgi:hypothetical protein
MNAALAELDRFPLRADIVEAPCCALRSDPTARVTVLHRGDEDVDLDVRSQTGTTAIVLQTDAPGWVARVDGWQTAIFHANVLYQAVSVPPGHHRVTLRYEPRSVTIGAAASGLGILGLILLALVSPRRSQALSRAAVHPIAPHMDGTE